MSDPPVRDICLLLVEDDELNRALVRTILARSADPMLRTARLIETGDLARSRVVLADTAVDLVLLDMRLPDGSGLDLAAQLKQSGAQGSPIVVALTGAAEPQLRSAALAAGCAAVLAKPYLAADLRDLLTAQLRRRGAVRPRPRAPFRHHVQQLTGGILVTAGAGLGEYSGVTASAREGAGLDFRALFESAPGSCLALNADFVIVAVSDAYLRDAKTSRADIVGQPILDIRPYCANGSGAAGAADLRASLERVRANCLPDAMAVQKYDIHQPESAGGGLEVRYWSPVNSPALNPRGRLAYIVHEVEDVTEYVRFKQQEARHQHLTQQLPRRAEQMEADIFARSQELGQANLALRADNDAKTQFLSRVSHQLRTPLNTILGFGELLSYSDITAEHREWMSMMLRAARSLVQLLDEALDISRTDAEHLSLSIEAVSVQEVIDDVLELARPLAISRGVHLDPPPRLEASLYAAADVRRLRQVVQKLLSNAIKYNHPAGQVTVTVDRRPGQRIRISIADTGRGILKDQIGSLFVPFERLDAARAGIEGTGLGLALSRQLIHKMDGTIGASSVPGEGSIFWIELPASEPAAVTQPAIGHDPLVASRAYSAPKTVLYVEDMVENLRLVEQVLKQRPSATVVPALLAGAALDLARQHRPDLILLDAHLPDMPGEEVIRQLLADPVTRNIPIIILSADTAQAHIEQLLAAGARAYLTKPIRVRELLQTVDDVLDQADPMLARSAVPADLASRDPSAPGGC